MLQRAVGWPSSTGWNKGRRTIDAAHKMVRVPLANLPVGNTQKAPNPAKTTEEADARAIAWIHPNIVVTDPVQVLLHLHGLTSRPDDPFAGWRENIADPVTKESLRAKAQYDEAVRKQAAAARRAKRAKKDPPPPVPPYVNPVGSKVRDVERDRIGQQIEALGDPQIMAVLPQGSGFGGPAAFGEAFDPNALAEKVLDRLVTERELTAKPEKWSIILSAHSAGGSAVAHALKGKRTKRVAGLILFDAIYGEASPDDPKKTISPQRATLLRWIEERCTAAALTLRTAGPGTDDAKKAIAEIPGVRGVWEPGYANTYETLQADIHRLVGRIIPAPHVPAVRQRFVVTKVGTSHDAIVGGSGTSSGPLQDALSQWGSFVTPPVQRDTGQAPKQATVKLTWTGELKNAAQLQPVLTKHPADLTANVTEGGRLVGSGNGTATFQVGPTPAKHHFRITPTAAAPGDYYYLATGVDVSVTADATTDATAVLPYNRENARFTERTWEIEGINVTKANNVRPATMFGLPVVGGLNALTATRVKAANDWFDDNANVTPADRTAARASIVSLVGRVKRTQSRGTYSNHSTGCAVDINPSEASLQNWHVKKDDRRHAKAMKLFNEVVSQPSVFDRLVSTLAGLVVPGVGNLSPFAGFDVWTERDRDRLLMASERFNAFFPDYLVALVTRADPSRTPAPTATTVMTLTAKDLKALAKKAKKAKHADVAESLQRIAEVWFEVRAWVGGYVITNKVKGGEKQGMLRSEFDAKRAKDSALAATAEMTGMISLHPALVKALTQGGWSWMVDYRHDDEKDFMHFEDRTAQQALTT